MSAERRTHMKTKTATPALPLVPYGNPKELDRELVENALYSCKRHDKAHCINSNFLRAFAVHQGREIRYAHTMRGAFHWSELIDGQWYRFRAPLRVSYARKIDEFDDKAHHFSLPARYPFGATEALGPCVPTVPVDPAVTRERKVRLKARIASGALKPGVRDRKPQLPFVLA